jgi:serine/threonine-protein kinase
MTHQNDYDLAEIRNLLLSAFTAPDLYNLFFYSKNPNLQSLTERINRTDARATMADTIIEYCKTQALLDDLLVEIKQANPRQYNLFAPRIGVPSDAEQTVPEDPVRTPIREVLTKQPGQLKELVQGPRETPIWQRIGIEMITIPAGEFPSGKDRVPLYLPEYRLAKTPVTNLQYKAFIEATSHRTPKHWENECIPAGKQDHPVVWVSWQDAQAFCQWAGCRLPSELEWEKAARGREGQKYPWGNYRKTKVCNNSEAGIGDTTSVTCYPGGASPYGLLDMAGNVWEWCADWFDDECRGRVLRGGSWRDNFVYVRSANRTTNRPSGTYELVGFRCAL